MITFCCSACQKPLSVPEDLAGQKVLCPGCRQATAVPPPIAVAPPPDQTPTLLPPTACPPANR